MTEGSFCLLLALFEGVILTNFCFVSIFSEKKVLLLFRLVYKDNNDVVPGWNLDCNVISILIHIYNFSIQNKRKILGLSLNVVVGSGNIKGLSILSLSFL